MAFVCGHGRDMNGRARTHLHSRTLDGSMAYKLSNDCRCELRIIDAVKMALLFALLLLILLLMVVAMVQLKI